jgi:hypothetical protein
MATQKVRSDPNAPERQHRDKRQHVAKRKATFFVLVAALVLGAAAIGISTLRDDTNAESTLRVGGVSPSPIPPLPGGSVAPGRYVFATSFDTTFDTRLDASHRITIDVPDGYGGHHGLAVIKFGTTQTAVGTLAIGDVYADACQWEGALLERSAIASTDDVAAALASQKGLRVSTPTDVTVDGFAGTYMERKVPARTDLSDCDLGQFRVYLDPNGEERYVYPGQLDLLWIVDVDGVPLVIDASLDPGTSAEVRAELLQMVESIQIDPREEG